VAKLFSAPLDPAQQPHREAARKALFQRLDDAFLATIEAVNRLTPTIVEVVVKAPYAAQHFEPGQFYRLQNFERTAPVIEGTRLTMEGLALTGAWVDKELGLMSTIVLEMGTSSRMCAMLKKGQRVSLMGPTGAPTHIASRETVLLAGGGLGNAVLFSIGQALRAAGCKVLYFAGYRKAEDAYKFDDLERAADQVIWLKRLERGGAHCVPPTCERALPPPLRPFCKRQPPPTRGLATPPRTVSDGSVRHESPACSPNRTSYRFSSGCCLNALPIRSSVLSLFVLGVIHTDPVLEWPVLIAHNRPTFSKSGWNDFRLVEDFPIDSCAHFPHPSLLTRALRVLTGILNIAAVCFGLLVCR
jgi:hypothetical protein